MADRTTPFDPTVLDRPKRDDSGPAFPVPVAEIHGIATHSGEFGSEMLGMSLRDYFAGQALAGLLANVTYNQFSGTGGNLCGGIANSDAAWQAYQLADAMIAERAKP
jgi:hypothetical protein